MRSCVRNTNDVDVSLSEWSKIEEKFWSMQDMYTRLLSANLDFDPELRHVFCWAPGDCRTLEYFTLIVFFFVFVERCFSCLAWVHRTLHVVGSFLTRTHVFLVTVCSSLVSLVLLLSGRQRLTSAEHVALSISVFLLSPFALLCLSQCFWNDTED